MAAPKQNQFWKLRTKHGRDKIFSTPQILWSACVEYFESIAKNPLYETIVQSGKIYQLPKMRAMTVEGLCIFLDIATKTFNEYCDIEDYRTICTRVKEIIKTQKFEGASAGLLNANIIARDLGLKEARSVEYPEGIKTTIVVKSQEDADLLKNALDKIE